MGSRCTFRTNVASVRWGFQQHGGCGKVTPVFCVPFQEAAALLYRAQQSLGAIPGICCCCHSLLCACVILDVWGVLGGMHPTVLFFTSETPYPGATQQPYLWCVDSVHKTVVWMEALGSPGDRLFSSSPLVTNSAQAGAPMVGAGSSRCVAVSRFRTAALRVEAAWLLLLLVLPPTGLLYSCWRGKERTHCGVLLTRVAGVRMAFC